MYWSDPLEGSRGARGSYISCPYSDDLDSILDIVGRLFGVPQPVNWAKFTFSKPHQR